VINRCWLNTQKVAVGKQGLVTGFLGSVELHIPEAKAAASKFGRLFFALGHLAPYCGTGHKTPFGLGQTTLGWLDSLVDEELTVDRETAIADRIDTLTEVFLAQRKRTGGDRASKVAQTWATILARREQGESLQGIAADLEMNYETVKTYVKLARRALREVEG